MHPHRRCRRPGRRPGPSAWAPRTRRRPAGRHPARAAAAPGSSCRRREVAGQRFEIARGRAGRTAHQKRRLLSDRLRHARVASHDAGQLGAQAEEALAHTRESLVGASAGAVVATWLSTSCGAKPTASARLILISAYASVIAVGSSVVSTSAELAVASEPRTTASMPAGRSRSTWSYAGASARSSASRGARARVDRSASWPEPERPAIRSNPPGSNRRTACARWSGRSVRPRGRAPGRAPAGRRRWPSQSRHRTAAPAGRAAPAHARG